MMGMDEDGKAKLVEPAIAVAEGQLDGKLPPHPYP